MTEKKQLRVSVRTLVERVLLSGDLGYGSPSLTVLLEGSGAHREYQASQEEGYEAEVPVSEMFEGEFTGITLQGRVDGIAHEMAHPVLEEIKSTRLELDYLEDARPEHWAQAKIYAAMLCKKRDLCEMGIRIIYIQLPSQKQRVFEETCSREELRSYLQHFLDVYLEREEALAHHELQRDEALEKMEFCHPHYRPGQRAMAGDIFRSLRDRSHCMVEAPTGIGKTAAALFGALKAMAQGHTEKIFYLCSRTTIKQIAQDTLDRFCADTLPLRRITLTAKQKCCACGAAVCDVQFCPYAKGFFDRLPEAIQEAFGLYRLDEAKILELAEKYTLCPFELSLNLAEISDVVICDYNYAFDPRVRLQRFFTDGGEYGLLIDEAHQLVDRARDMFSARITRKDVRTLREQLPKGKLKGDIKRLRKAAQDLYQAFRELDAGMTEEKYLVRAEAPESMTQACRQFCDAAAPMLDAGFAPWSAAMADLYFICRNYAAAAKDFDEHFRFLAEKKGRESQAALLCIDPQKRLQSAYKKCRSVVLFSATLTPHSYFQRLLGVQEASCRSLPSPFDPEQLCVMVRTDVSTAYRHRQGNYEEVADSLYAFVSAKGGHYMAFFPSYAYLRAVREIYAEKYPETELVSQETDMEELARRAFLERFRGNTSQTLLGFVVMGGFFAEGIDLSGESLIGAILVGVGLPQLNPERDEIAAYHRQLGEDGFRYAYQYPGFHRVLQAAGRVIRTREDRGAILLIDPRFVRKDYLELMPPLWFPLKGVESTQEIRQEAEAFWSQG